MRMTAVSAGIHPEPDAIKAEKAQGSDTVWIRFGEYPAHATLFLDRATARALREALADAEALMPPEPQPLPDELAPDPALVAFEADLAAFAAEEYLIGEEVPADPDALPF